MRRVELRVRHLMARDAFKAGGFEASLYDVDSASISTGVVAFKTRGHATWVKAAKAAVKKADRAAWQIVHRALVARKIAEEEA